MTTSSAVLEADLDGALTASGGHFRRDFIDAAPHDDYSRAGTRSQRCLDRGVDGGGPTPSELESLRDIYMAAGMDDSAPIPDHPEPESRMDLLAGRVVDMVARGDVVLEEPRHVS